MGLMTTLKKPTLESKEAGRGFRHFKDEYRGHDGPGGRGTAARVRQRPQGGRGRVPRGLVGGKRDGLGQGPPPGREQEQGTEPDEIEAAPAQGQVSTPINRSAANPAPHAWIVPIAPMPHPRTAGSNSSAITTTANSVSATAKVRAQNCRRTNPWAVGAQAVAPVKSV